MNELTHQALSLNVTIPLPRSGSPVDDTCALAVTMASLQSTSTQSYTTGHDDFDKLCDSAIRQSMDLNITLGGATGLSVVWSIVQALRKEYTLTIALRTHVYTGMIYLEQSLCSASRRLERALAKQRTLAPALWEALWRIEDACKAFLTNVRLLAQAKLVNLTCGQRYFEPYYAHNLRPLQSIWKVLRKKGDPSGRRLADLVASHQVRHVYDGLTGLRDMYHGALASQKAVVGWISSLEQNGRSLRTWLKATESMLEPLEIETGTICDDAALWPETCQTRLMLEAHFLQSLIAAQDLNEQVASAAQEISREGSAQEVTVA